jgi:hypothetical protein
MKQEPSEVIRDNCNVHCGLGPAGANYSCIRHADLARLTLNRLVGISIRVGWRFAEKLRVKHSLHACHAAIA